MNPCDTWPDLWDRVFTVAAIEVVKGSIFVVVGDDGFPEVVNDPDLVADAICAGKDVYCMKRENNANL